jgi:hypothetical protein
MPDARKRANPRDFTGLQKQQLEEQHAQELEERATEVAMQTQVAAERRSEVVDYSKGGARGPKQVQPGPVPHISPEMRAEIEEQAVEVGPQDVTIRVNTKIEDMVYARGVEPPEFDEEGRITKHAIDHGLQFYSFEEGTPYKVPVDLAMHLEEKGYLYH